jgi:TPR repeat protein
MLGAGIKQKKMNGAINKPDYKKAYHYFNKSSDYYYSPAVAMCMYYMISGLKYQSTIQISSKLKSQYKKARYQGNANVYFYHDYAITQKIVPLKFVETVYGHSFRLAAARNHPKAHYYLATRHPKYIDFEMYNKAAKLNFIPAYVKVGDCYFGGNSAMRKHGKSSKWVSVQVNMGKAFNWYKKSAEVGDIAGKYKLGCCYALGAGTKQDIAVARKLFNAAVKKRLPRAMIALIMLEQTDKELKSLFFAGKETAAFQLLNKDNNPDNLFIVAICLKYGIGTEQDKLLALELLLKSSNPYATLEVGKCYEEGIGTDKDIKQAIKFYQKAVNKKVPNAEYYLAEAYYKSYQKISDRNLAFRWYQVAAKASNASAAFKLGEIYFTGISRVPKDYKKAYAAFQHAAELGSTRALYILGDMC